MVHFLQLRKFDGRGFYDECVMRTSVRVSYFIAISSHKYCGDSAYFNGSHIDFNLNIFLVYFA